MKKYFKSVAATLMLGTAVVNLAFLVPTSATARGERHTYSSPAPGFHLCDGAAHNCAIDTSPTVPSDPKPCDCD
jgi:hypothetical protein